MLCSVQRPLSHAGGDAGRMDAQRLGGQHACPANRWLYPPGGCLVELREHRQRAAVTCVRRRAAAVTATCHRDVLTRRRCALESPGTSPRRQLLFVADDQHACSQPAPHPPTACTEGRLHRTGLLSRRRSLRVRSPRPRSIFTVTCAPVPATDARTPRRRRHSRPRTLIAAVAARALHPAACRCAARFGAAPLGPPSRGRAPLSPLKSVHVFAQHARQRLCPGSPRVGSGCTPASASPTQRGGQRRLRRRWAAEDGRMRIGTQVITAPCAPAAHARPASRRLVGLRIPERMRLHTPSPGSHPRRSGRPPARAWGGLHAVNAKPGACLPTA
jgi:hypothetical protein